MVSWLGHSAPTAAPPAAPITAPIAVGKPLPPGATQKEFVGEQGWYVAAPIPAPTPAPTAPPMAALRKRCLFTISLTLRTSCLWIVWGPEFPCSEISLSDTLKNVPESFLEVCTT